MTSDTIKHLPLREKLSYPLGDFASVLYFQAFSVFLTYYYTDVFGLTAAATGMMLGLSRSLDAFFDPVMGMMADRTKTRWGKFRPYLLWMCVPFAIAGVLTFTVPQLGSSGKLAWAIITYNALMLIFTAITIPYNAMMGVMSPNPQERTALSSWKFVGSYGGGMVASATLFPLSKLLGQGNEARGWQLTFVVFGIVAIACFLLTFINSRERVQPPPEQKTSMLRDVMDLFTNVPWLVLSLSTFLFMFAVMTRGSVTVYYFKYYVGTQTLTLPSWLPKIGGTQVWEMDLIVPAFTTVNMLCAIIGVLLVPHIARVLGRKTAYLTLYSVGSLGSAAFYFLAPNQVGMMFALLVFGSILNGGLPVLQWAMFADVADYNEWKRGRRATGLVFSASILTQKQGMALGSWLALTLMASFGFKANELQSVESLRGLVLLMSLIPGVIVVTSLLTMAFYPLNEKKMARITTDLTARRAGGAPAPAGAGDAAS